MTTDDSAGDRRADLEALIADLVRIETENPPGNEKPGAEFIADWFDSCGVDAQLVLEPDEKRPQVVAHVGDGEPTVVLNGHIDVFPAGDRSRWTHDPYGADIVDDSLYGRGCVDMKTGVALGMLAVRDLGAELDDGHLDGSIIMHAAMGEETAEPGTKRLVELGYDGDYGIVLEPTELETVTSTKGLAWYEITVVGEPEHAAYPDLGVNAISQALPIVEAIEAYDEQVRTREHELCGCEYATITNFEAGTKENVLPESATITVDRRFSPGRSVEEIDAEIDEVITEAIADRDIEVTWERTRVYEPSETSPENDVAQVFRELSSTIDGVSGTPRGVRWACDVRNLVNDAGMEHAITWGPGDTTQAGTVDERIDLNEAETGLELLKSGIRELLEDGR